MKIYIIGKVASGKSTLARKLSSKYNTPYFSLDDVRYDKERKRSNEEQQQLFNQILSNDSWIIEDVGRKEFINGMKQADQILYLDIQRWILYKRIITRYILQKLNKEATNYHPTIKMLNNMFRWCNKDLRNKKNIKEDLVEYQDKIRFLSYQEIKQLI